jgi:kanamycin kinase
MKLTKITVNNDFFPDEIREFIGGNEIFDSSSSPEARVYFINKDDGYFLKTGESGTLKRESQMGKYFHQKGLAPEILLYKSESRDFLLSRKARGVDATSKIYLENPRRLAAKMGEVLRELHSLDFKNCPVNDRMADYFETLEKNAFCDKYDLSFGNFSNKDEAYDVAKSGRAILKSDTLIHGDFCLPNILFDNWHFTSFIDLGGAGVGDRHVDIFWGAWTLKFNLKTDKYRDIFLDSYGKERIENDALIAVSAAEIFG